jgi:hypothetical protein
MVKVMTDRSAARLVGALFIMATAPFSLSVVILEPVVGVSDFLSRVSASEARVGIGVLLELINHVAVVGIAVVIYPVLKRFSERLAMGYVAARSIESVLFAIGTMHLLTLLVVSREFVAAGTPGAMHFQTLGAVLLAGHDWDSVTLPFAAFSVGSMMLNYTLYRARLVPRWISVWGLLAAASILGARVALLSGVQVSSATVTLMDTPIFLQEMVFAVWLILRGFDISALATGARALERATK